MCTLSFVTDVHLSFVTYLPMHLDRIETRMFRQGCHRQARGTTHRTTYDSIKEHPCGPPPGLGLAANLGGRSPEPKKKTRSLQLLQAYWSPVHPYILKDKADLGHFSVQKVFCGFGIVRSNSKQPRSSKNTINYRGEILYPLLNI